MSLTQLTSVLNDAITSGIPGLSVALANQRGLLWQGTAGMADCCEPRGMTPEHLLGIGSISKTFVAVVVLQLAEQGRLSLEHTALDYLDPDSSAGRAAAGVANAHLATLAQLLNHTGGIPSWEDDPLWIREGRGEQLDIRKHWQPIDTLPYIEQTAALHSPGERYAYANTNHTLLGLVIEAVTGQPLVEVISQHILQPLQLRDIYLEGFQPLPADRLATRYHYATAAFKRDAGVHPQFPVVNQHLINASASNLSVEWAAGGMAAAAGDLALYAAALSQGQLLSPESMALLQQWFPVSDNLDVGHGVFKTRIEPGVSLIGHMGSVLGYTGSMQWLAGSDLVMVVLANVGTMHIGESLPSAASVASSRAFIEAAVAYGDQLVEIHHA